jgi:glycosyltransferase involved in cell wall biosynthesis
MKKKVCHFTIVHKPEDTRIFHKECKSLAKEYDVTLVTTCDNTFDKDGVHMLGIGYPKSTADRIKRIFSIIPLLRRLKADAYHFHDPELILTGFLLKKLYGKTVVYDVHEHYTSKFRVKKLGRFSGLKNIIIKGWTWMERWMGNQFDLVVSADSFTASQFTKPPSIVIANVPTLNFIRDVNAERIIDHNQEFRVVYLGTIHELRGLRTAVEAIEKVKYPNIQLHVIGESRYPELTKLFQESKRVVYHGSIPWQVLNDELKKCHLGIALFHPVPAFTYYPGENIVKLFEYAGLGIPYLISNFDKLNNFVRTNGGGLTVDPLDTSKIAETIEKVYLDQRLYSRLRNEGIAMVREKYNWENQEKILLQAYSTMLAKKR